MSPRSSRLPKRRTLLALAALCALVALYAAIGYLIAPRLIERALPGVALRATGQPLAVARVAVDPFRLVVVAEDLRWPAASPRLFVPRMRVDLAWTSLLRSGWQLDEVAIDAPHLEIVRDAEGRFELATLWSPESRNPAREAQRDDPRPARIDLALGRIARATLAYRDARQGEAEPLVIGPINGAVHDVSTVADEAGNYRLHAVLPEGGELRWHGSLDLAPLASSGEIELAGVALGSMVGLTAAAGAPDLHGQLDLHAAYRVVAAEAAPIVALTSLRAAVRDLALTRAHASEPFVALDRVAIEDGRFDLGARTLTLPMAKIEGGEIAIASEDTGSAGPAAALAPARAAPLAPAVGSGAPWQIALEKLDVENVAVRYAEVRDGGRMAATGRLRATASARIAVGDGIDLQLDAPQLALAQVHLGGATPGGDEAEPWTADAVTVSSAQVDTARREASAAAVRWRGGRLVVGRQADGALRPPLAALVARAPSAAATAQPSPPWRWKLDQVALEDVAVAYRDPALTPLGLDAALSGDVGPLASHPDRAAAWRAALALAAGGRVEATGSLAPGYQRVEAKMSVDALPLALVAPFLEARAAVALRAGTASASAEVAYAAGADAPLRVAGTLQLDDVRVDERGAGDRLLAWRSLVAEGVDFAWPGRLRVRDVRVERPGVKVAIAKDGALNLAQVVATRSDTPGDHRAVTQDTALPRDVRIERVRLRNGVLDFSDASLVLPFSTRIGDLGGSVVGLGTGPSAQARIEAEGRVAPYGAARVTGAVRLVAPTESTFLRIKLDNLAMPPLSPYTATFAGRKIESGRLWLDLRYRLREKRLEAQNGIVMDDVVLGERVAAPRARDLPLDLALALLRDRQGRIQLAIPVSGSLGDPQFDYGRIFRQALVETFQRIASAPFRALADLAGDESAAELQGIAFAPGSATLSPEQEERLVKVASALGERPALRLVVRGPYDPDRDAAALRTEAARRSVARAAGRTLEPGENAGPVDFGAAATQLALETLLRQHAGEGAVEALAQEYARERGAMPERVNRFFAAFGGGAGTPGFYRAVLRRLEAVHPIADEAVAALAQARADAIIARLCAAGVDAPRIARGAPLAATSDAGGVRAELSLETAHDPSG